jgi:hypothetical protein
VRERQGGIEVSQRGVTLEKGRHNPKKRTDEYDPGET